jgi:Ca-activated chloride channel family protein
MTMNTRLIARLAVAFLALLAASAGLTACAHPVETLTVIAGSELRDLEPLLPQIKAATGVNIVFTYSGTLAGIDRIHQGASYDAAWFAQSKYFRLTDPSRIVVERTTMISPVILGVKESKARELGWTDGHNVSWRQISRAAGSGRFRFAMTNPAASNTGFSSVIGVAAAFSPSGDVLSKKDVNPQGLRDFFLGQRLIAGSSAWLIDAFVKQQDQLDGIVNYESTLISLNQSKQLKEPLTLVYPKEGIITADYPLILLNPVKRAAYDKLAAYLTGADFQRLAMEQTNRRPVNPDVKLSDAFPKGLVIDLTFPSSPATVDRILSTYLNAYRVPSHAYYLLDVSGSMSGPKLRELKDALYTLAGDDPSLTGKFARFEDREKITLIAFNGVLEPPLELQMRGSDDQNTFAAIKAYANDLHASGGTVLYGAVEKAVDLANADRLRDHNRFYSIVVMTDGVVNRGPTFADFTDYYKKLSPESRVKIFPVTFGEGSKGELREVAAMSGGQLFDGTRSSLTEVFKDIRGYQ